MGREVALQIDHRSTHHGNFILTYVQDINSIRKNFLIFFLKNSKKVLFQPPKVRKKVEKSRFSCDTSPEFESITIRKSSYILLTGYFKEKWLQYADDVIIFKFFENFSGNFFMGPNKLFYVSSSVEQALSISEIRFSIATRAMAERRISTPK